MLHINVKQLRTASEAMVLNHWHCYNSWMIDDMAEVVCVKRHLCHNSFLRYVSKRSVSYQIRRFVHISGTEIFLLKLVGIVKCEYIKLCSCVEVLYSWLLKWYWRCLYRDLCYGALSLSDHLWIPFTSPLRLLHIHVKQLFMEWEDWAITAVAE